MRLSKLLPWHDSRHATSDSRLPLRACDFLSAVVGSPGVRLWQERPRQQTLGTQRQIRCAGQERHLMAFARLKLASFHNCSVERLDRGLWVGLIGLIASDPRQCNVCNQSCRYHIIASFHYLVPLKLCCCAVGLTRRGDAFL